MIVQVTRCVTGELEGEHELHSQRKAECSAQHGGMFHRVIQRHPPPPWTAAPAIIMPP